LIHRHFLFPNIFFLPEPIDKTDPVTDTDPLCCDVPESKRNEECYPVEIPSGDPFYALFRRRCMEFVRSASSLKGECKLGKPIHRPHPLVDIFQITGPPSELMCGPGVF
jgi:hypothetical protein